MSGPAMRHVAVSLVLRIEDFVKGTVLSPADVSVSAHKGLTVPLYKADGYFLFIGLWPKLVHISSPSYEEVWVAPPQEAQAGVYRVSLLPKVPPEAIYPLSLPSGSEAHVGFDVVRGGCALATKVSAGDTTITLHTPLQEDITSRYGVLFASGEASASLVFSRQHLGRGLYRLDAPAQVDCPLRGSRLLPLRRIIGPASGIAQIPLPEKAVQMLLLREGKITVEAIEQKEG